MTKFTDCQHLQNFSTTEVSSIFWKFFVIFYRLIYLHSTCSSFICAMLHYLIWIGSEQEVSMVQGIHLPYELELQQVNVSFTRFYHYIYIVNEWKINMGKFALTHFFPFVLFLIWRMKIHTFESRYLSNKLSIV